MRARSEYVANGWHHNKHPGSDRTEALRHDKLANQQTNQIRASQGIMDAIHHVAVEPDLEIDLLRAVNVVVSQPLLSLVDSTIVQMKESAFWV